MAESRGYLPALRFPALTRVYDPLIALTTRERLFRRRLLERAQITDGQRVLDLGCGTGTLLLLTGELNPGADLVGLDPDPEILERARAKAARAGVEIAFDQGLSTELPYEDRSFDRVLSTLVFHHLGIEALPATAAEIARVLQPGAELHFADWGPPTGPLMAALSWQVRLFDGVGRTRPNFDGRLPACFDSAGLVKAAPVIVLGTAFGTLALHAYRRPIS